MSRIEDMAAVNGSLRYSKDLLEHPGTVLTEPWWIMPRLAADETNGMSAQLNDFSKLDLSEDGIIKYKIRAQDGSFIPMTVKDTKHNRRFVSWVQIHDSM